MTEKFEKVENVELVHRGLRILRESLAIFIFQVMKKEYVNQNQYWWPRIVNLIDPYGRDLPSRGTDDELRAKLDVAACLKLMTQMWNEMRYDGNGKSLRPFFRKYLPREAQGWCQELIAVRNRAAHSGEMDFSGKDTWRALDTMSLLCGAVGGDGTEKLNEMLRDFLSNFSIVPEPKPETPSDSQKGAETISPLPARGLPSWRDVMRPHPDVAAGNFLKAEYAADLAQVARGEGTLEYRDPVEFFNRTFVTEGMKGLLVQAVKRVSGRGGEAVIQLKTAFGGGKTHSMLALYHMMRCRDLAEKIPSVKDVFDTAGLTSLPKVNVAVVVGTAIDPTKSRRPLNLPGATVNTLWGEIAAQLCVSAGKPQLYDLVKEADKKGVSPGSQALKDLFDSCGSCLVLIDELVAYARKLYDKYQEKSLPAGTYGNLLTFIQELTEAARLSRDSLVVASIPESSIEIGDEGGKTALAAIEHTFGRVEAIWKPVAANEGFEVVRRRLFLPCDSNKLESRDAVCKAFSEMYVQNSGDFPPEARELAYRDRMVACYPIHPEVFDRLYDDWATLEHFQKTRGVLRLMAEVIRELWMGNDASAMIMPGSIPLNIPAVRDELTKYLSDNWNSIVDNEVDGKGSIPYRTDGTDRYGALVAARRVARTILLGSAPSVPGQSLRGIESSRVRLGTVQPGENISVFNDALNQLRSELTYLYSDASGSRFWYDTRPTLRKTAEDRASQITTADVYSEIEKRLRNLPKERLFAGVHVCPTSSLEINDDQQSRLVILGPEVLSKKSDDLKAKSPEIERAEEFYAKHGDGPRTYKNMLLFVAPAADAMANLKEETRRYLAWKSINDDKVSLNLDASQVIQAGESLKRASHLVDSQLNETWRCLLVPGTQSEGDLRAVSWKTYNIAGGTDTIVKRAADKLISEEALIAKWGSALLVIVLEGVLKNVWLGKKSLPVKNLWDYLTSYPYLPRLVNFDVLKETIRDGVLQGRFGLADSVSSDGKFAGLKFGEEIFTVERTMLLVEADVAKKQKEEEKSKDDRGGGGGGGVRPVTPIDPDPPKKVQPSKKTRFSMTAELDSVRWIDDLGELSENIIVHLPRSGGNYVKITLEVSAVAPEGFSQDVIRTVSENCNTKKVSFYTFEEK